MLRFVANASRFAGAVAERWVKVGGLGTEPESIVERAGADAFGCWNILLAGGEMVFSFSGTAGAAETGDGEAMLDGEGRLKESPESKDKGGNDGGPGFVVWFE